MLVLSREGGQAIVIVVPPGASERRIVVSVAHLRHDRVKLGCSAAADVAINRAEVQAKIDGQQAA